MIGAEVSRYRHRLDFNDKLHSTQPLDLQTSLTMPAASASASPSPAPESAGLSALPAPANRHAPTAVEVQRMQLARLLKDPSKPAPVPAPTKEKTIRPAREMMKNVQGSSAGAGSGEFHVYKAARRREYERVKIMEEKAAKVRLCLLDKLSSCR